MPRNAANHLEDMLGSARMILNYVGDRDEQEFLNDQMLQDAVERRFTIIGEALNRLRGDAPELARQIRDAAAVRSFRNIIVHQYEAIDGLNVLGIVRDDLPDFIAVIEALLESGN